MAQCLQTALDHPTDVVARYGGEEFAIILPHAKARRAIAVAETIQQAIAQAQIPHVQSPVSSWLPLSLGVATVTPNVGDCPDQLIQLADSALYYAKHNGRNTLYQQDD